MPLSILLIEDNEQNRYLTTFLMVSSGYKVIYAADGPRALEIVKTTVPDAILLDIQLPLMDGYAVARALRSYSSMQDVPIIAVTSYAMVGDREKALAAGCNGYIEKPINPETFVAEIASFIFPVPTP